MDIGDDLELAWMLWQECQTQLRFSFGGIAGLDWAGIKVVLDALGIETDSWIVACFGIMERDILLEQAKGTDDGGAGKDSC